MCKIFGKNKWWGNQNTLLKFKDLTFICKKHSIK